MAISFRKALRDLVQSLDPDHEHVIVCRGGGELDDSCVNFIIRPEDDWKLFNWLQLEGKEGPYYWCPECIDVGGVLLRRDPKTNEIVGFHECDACTVAIETDESILESMGVSYFDDWQPSEDIEGNLMWFCPGCQGRMAEA